MKRADIRTWLRLYGRRWPRRIELQKERPVTAAPLEQRLGVAALGGVMQIVLARGDVWQQTRVLAPQYFTWLRLSLQPVEGLTCRNVRSRSGPRHATFPHAGMGRLGQFRHRASAPDAHDEQPRPDLRHPIIGGVEHLRVPVVSSLTDLTE